MGIIRRLTKQLFGRNQVVGDYDVIIDGEIVPSNEEPERAEIESSGYGSNLFETKPEPIKNDPAKTEPVFQ